MFPSGLVTDAETLYQQYHRAVYAYLTRLTNDPDWAEDLLQETFYRAIAHATSYRGEAAPLAWLCAIGRRLFLTQVRRRARDRSKLAVIAESQPVAVDSGPETAALGRERLKMIVDTIDGLTDTQRLALLLRDWDGLPYETIAQILGLTLTNVKVTIHRARARFRETYREKGGGDDE